MLLSKPVSPEAKPSVLFLQVFCPQLPGAQEIAPPRESPCYTPPNILGGFSRHFALSDAFLSAGMFV